jgi:alcohol dehydrogenase
MRACGACPACLADRRVECEYFVFNGYFGFPKEKSQTMYDLYPHGGFCE